MPKKVCIIGSEGNLGKRIRKGIEPNYDCKLVDIIDTHGQQRENPDALLQTAVSSLNETDVIILATPPSTHKGLIETLRDQNKTTTILCEKPLPEIPFVGNAKSSEGNDNVRIIDHYLYKDSLPDILREFQIHRDNISRIELSICETDQESRPWMLSKSAFGGVTYDLAHHLFAILGEMFGYETLQKVKTFVIHDIKNFDTPSDTADDAADKQMEFSATIDGILIKCEVAKNHDENNKTICFFNREGEQIAAHNLQAPVDYKHIIESLGESVSTPKSRLLTIEQASIINKLLSLITKEAEKTIDSNDAKKKLNKDAVGLLQNLEEEFKHRHSFYWSSYYRLLFYHLFVVSLPWILYYNASVLGGNKSIVGMICLFLSCGIWGYFNWSLLEQTRKYLDDEDHRMKIAIDKLREIYKSVYELDLYPNKTGGSGLGARYMFVRFKEICNIACGVSVLLFAVVLLFEGS